MSEHVTSVLVVANETLVGDELDRHAPQRAPSTGRSASRSSRR